MLAGAAAHASPFPLAFDRWCSASTSTTGPCCAHLLCEIFPDQQVLSITCNGVSPRLVLAFASAPWASNNLALAASPALAARCSGVQPATSSAIGEDPCSRNHFTISVPYEPRRSTADPGKGALPAHAEWRGVRC